MFLAHHYQQNLTNCNLYIFNMSSIMDNNKITLYDLAQRGETNRCWSYNVWKIRLVLNYKKIPFTTAWVDHNTLGPTLKSLGVPPNTTGGFEFTVPTIKLPDGLMVTDSAVIASRLEGIYPSPALHLDLELQAQVDRVVHMTCMPLFAIYMPQVARELIDKATVPAFSKSREKRFGMTLEELETSKGAEKAWVAAESGFAAMKEILTSHKKDEGPFIRGSQVCYADFALVAVFEAFKRVGNGMFERALEWDTAFSDLYRASQAWLQNDM
ncbi:putative glutathione s-transferase [Colletotrichum karsti]|uniref:Glutathione s-transferase n=1 Tax=Colletotrichum karsti TaxID=1095194 RepID=A0A9P6HYP4_9PEZI|nr:putative glutathione s-transferase [Colletotrichum karsti]KAF9872557.1 putative glutathione s-transferase [Colletotrichum karsti]